MFGVLRSISSRIAELGKVKLARLPLELIEGDFIQAIVDVHPGSYQATEALRGVASDIQALPCDRACVLDANFP